MPLISLKKNDQIMMSLVHYFVTKENYTPINVQGVKDEIWLENLEGPYRVIRISCNTIINDEQYKFDLFKMQHILKQIKKKTLSFKVNALNICLDISKNVILDSRANIETINVKSIQDAKKNKDLTMIFPLMKEELMESKDSLDLIVNVTNDINAKTEKENTLFAKIFSPKKIIVTHILIILCIIAFVAMTFIGNGSTDVFTLLKFGANYYPLVKAGEVWRLITSAFLHIGLMHLLVNMYSLFVIGSQVENFLGKWKMTMIYIMSALSGSLLSIALHTDTISAGASGAIFGLMGALLYFGYHYRLYLNDALRKQIIPVILINLVIGFALVKGVDNAAHIGGLFGGYLTAMALGIEGKTTKQNMINGWIVLSLYIIFLSLIIFVF